MTRFYFSFIFVLAMVFAVGCPPTVDDDDDSTPPVTEDDDDAADDDDDATPDPNCVDNVPSYSTATAVDLDGMGLPATVENQLLCEDDFNADYELYIDFFAVTATAGSYLQAELGPGPLLTTDCSAQTMVLLIIDPDLNTIAAGDTSAGTCPVITAEPAPGQYYVVVFSDAVASLPQDYSLTVSEGQSVCGDGTLEGVEECDDGNLVGGDGCTATCLNEDAACPIEGDVSDALDGAPVAGNTSAATDNHAPSCSAAGSAEVVYTYTQVDTGAVVASTVSANTAYDTVLYVRTDCFDPTAEIVCNDDVNEAYQAEVGWIAEAGVEYFIMVDGYSGEAGAFELIISAPVCGNGTVEAPEICDDGNLIDGDGCESDCTVTPVCGIGADTDLGLLGSGSETVVTVDLDAEDDNMADVVECPEAGVGGGDYLIAFGIETAGDLTIDIDHTAPGDAQYAVFFGGLDAGGSRDFADDDDSAGDDDDSAADDDDSAADDDDSAGDDDDSVADDDDDSVADDDDDVVCDAVEVPAYGYCIDIYPNETALVTLPVTEGTWFFLMDAFADGGGGTVTATIAAP
jgi:cysteine-rich repeat protein